MFLTISDQSSTALHILLRINIHYTIFWFILEIILFIFKYYNVPYGTNAFGIEMSMIFMLCFNEFLRQFFAIKGNLTLRTDHLIISIIYGIVGIIGFVFFLVWQSYIQRVEILLSAIGLTLIAIEILLSIITIILNCRAMPVLTDQEKLQRLNEAQKQFQSSIKTE
jgi:transmembrane protein 216